MPFHTTMAPYNIVPVATPDTQPIWEGARQGKLMVRMVAAELSGRRLEPTRDEIIRTVGNPPPMKGQ